MKKAFLLLLTITPVVLHAYSIEDFEQLSKNLHRTVDDFTSAHVELHNAFLKLGKKVVEIGKELLQEKNYLMEEEHLSSQEAFTKVTDTGAKMFEYLAQYVLDGTDAMMTELTKVGIVSRVMLLFSSDDLTEMKILLRAAWNKSKSSVIKNKFERTAND